MYIRILAFILALLFAPSAFAQCAITNTNPAFTGGGNLWGRNSAQVNQYFGLKTDANNGILCSPTIQQLLLGPDGGQWTSAGIGNTNINNSPIGLTTPSTGAFTTLSVGGIPVPGGQGLIGIQTFCSSGCMHTTGTYTPDTGTNLVVIDIQAPGGGSGGCGATTTGQACATAGASAGSFIEFLLTSGFSGITATAPAGGAAGAAGNNAGTTASAASFGTIYSCPGGTGSSGAAGATAPVAWSSIATHPAAPAACSTSSGSPVVVYSIIGSVGGNAVAAGSAANQQQSGIGGAADHGIPAPGIFTSTTSAGATGTGYGAGATGAVSIASQAAAAGAAGSQSIIVIKEFN